MTRTTLFSILLSSLVILLALPAFGDDIIHDAEYYMLHAEHGERWAEEDKAIDTKLAEIRRANGGKPPNIVYILMDDVGFGEIGSKELSVVRGYDTPNIAAMAKDGLSLQRMYTEPSCTPTRVAMMTGRYPTRTGTTEAKATLAGDGLHADEVTIAEVLRDSGYYTSHVGKWHLGDIHEAYANEQGFMHAEFPIHQQGQLAIMNVDAEMEDNARGLDPNGSSKKFTLDSTFIPNAGDMVTGVELRDGKLYEVDLKPGEEWNDEKYQAMNERYQRNAVAQLGELAKQDKPFFLNYWPLLPSTFSRASISEFKTLNGGVWAEAIVQVDEWIGEIVDEIERLGIADNTIIIVMGDNGPFMQYRGMSGGDDRVYRGGKGDHLEGGVRANAYVRWDGVIEPGTYAEDMIHVSDLFTTLARIAGGTDEIPTDRIIDGLDQTGILLLGETHGRRDYVHIYEGPTLMSVVKNKYKMHLPPPGENPILATIYDLYRDSREARPSDSIKYAVWAGGSFVAMIKRHAAFKMKYPDREPGQDMPYGGIVNLRPETQALVEAWAAGKPGK